MHFQRSYELRMGRGLWFTTCLVFALITACGDEHGLPPCQAAKLDERPIGGSLEGVLNVHVAGNTQSDEAFRIVQSDRHYAVLIGGPASTWQTFVLDVEVNGEHKVTRVVATADFLVVTLVEDIGGLAKTWKMVRIDRKSGQHLDLNLSALDLNWTWEAVAIGIDGELWLVGQSGLERRITHLVRMTADGTILQHEEVDWRLLSHFWSFPTEGEVRFRTSKGYGDRGELWQWNRSHGLNKVTDLSHISDIAWSTYWDITPLLWLSSREFAATHTEVVYDKNEAQRHTFALSVGFWRDFTFDPTWRHHRNFSGKFDVQTRAVGSMHGAMLVSQEPKGAMVRIFSADGKAVCESPLPAGDLATNDELWADPQRPAWVRSALHSKDGMLWERSVVWTP